MPISVTCHGCGKRLKAKDALIGRTVPCPACGTKLRIGSDDDIAAALLRDDAEGPPDEPEAPAPPEDAAPQEREAEPPPRRAPAPTIRRKPARPADVTTLPPLTTKDPPLWLRHLHWLLALSLIPLAVSLLQKNEEQDMRWYDWIVRAVAVVAVPMVLHGFYDTLLKKDLNALALAAAVGSFLWLAFQISRLRGADDQTAQADMLREYRRRRKAMGAR